MSRVYSQPISPSDPRLGRHVRHDALSWRFPYPTTGLEIASVRWERHVPIFDQGRVGSCTGNAAIGVLCTGLLWPIHPDTRYTPDEAGALAIYSDAEDIDGDGPYPPQDNGSSGLSVAKAAKARGMIAEYRHTFGIDDALRALTITPLITGIPWYEGMFTPDAQGVLTVTGRLAGGHEIVVDEYDAARQLVGFTNSWGASWGADGRFYLHREDWAQLLDRDGDVTVLVPQAAPTPGPASPVDAALAAAMRHDNWVEHHHVGDNQVVAKAAKLWLTAKGL